MREINLSPSRSKDLKSAQTIFNEKKLEMHERRCKYRKSNTKFELYREKFYIELRKDKYGPHNVPDEDVKSFWSNMWEASKEENQDFSKYLLEFVPPDDRETPIFPSFTEFEEIIKWLANWKAAL
ncbi:hypothetical protein NGRA_2057 [Nosema granulosis]|uniref:Uncharacterized protein n=1 Tax=Nosema granulosis TaxID=83296 RepID=A0A9P6GXE6_9MICR|nr:hypothetical protein NGRA_2057 [Nosema granulosis]